MAGVSPELQAKMQRFGKKTEGNSCVVQIERSEGQETAPDTYRNGWTRPLQVKSLTTFVPQDNAPTSGNRANSVPGLKRGVTGSMQAVCGSVRDRWRPQGLNEPIRAVPRCNAITVPGGREMLGAGVSNENGGCGVRDTDSDTAMSTRSGHSMQSASSIAPSSAVVAGTKLCHEGWLQKETSAKIATRWQRRYFTLEGCVLRYLHCPGGPVKRAFDIRRAKQIIGIPSQPRVLELDFGFRIWRLRAESPASARRWLLLLEAGRLVAGPEEPFDEYGNEDNSDDDTSSCISTDSASSMGSTHITTPTVRAGSNSTARGKLELHRAPAIKDEFEVNPDELDKKFDSWFLPDGEDDAVGIKSRFGGKCFKKGLDSALKGLWHTLGAGVSSQTTACCENALKALVDLHHPEPQALGDALEGVISEYLSRMRQHVERWIENSDPLVGEIADVTQWFLFEARPALVRFEAGAAKLTAKPPTHWRGTADSIENFLLSEWESRSCEDVVRQCERIYSLTSDSSRQQLHGPARADASLQILQTAIQQGAAWRGHAAACDRSVSVLIAALNAVLRLYRISIRTLIEQPASFIDGLNWRNNKERLGQAFRGFRRRARSLSKGALQKAPELGATSRGSGRDVPECNRPSLFQKEREEKPLSMQTSARNMISAAATEAALIAEFCRKTEIEVDSPGAAFYIRTDVLAAFVGAFERECAKLCTVLIQVYFVTAHHKEIKAINFSTQVPQHSVLSGACNVASIFLKETCAGAPKLCGSLASEMVIQLFVKQWARQFQHAPPKLSTCPLLPETILADEAMLLELAEQWGGMAKWKSNSIGPVQTLREVRLMLSNSSPEVASLAEARLGEILGAEQGHALAGAVRRTLS